MPRHAPLSTAVVALISGSAITLAITLALTVTASCSSTGEASPPAADAAPDQTQAPDAAEDAGTVDTGPDGACASVFGTGLTEGFGRLDGVVHAVQKPTDTACPQPNSDHVIVQVAMNGDIYRMVVNVQSDRAGQDPKIRYAEVPHDLPAPPFEEGWHTGVPLDYANMLGVHSDGGFAPLAMNDAVAKIVAAVKVGAPVAVYAESGAGRPESAHLIHRNSGGNNSDGAIVVDPDGASPTFLLFHFDGQSF